MIFRLTITSGISCEHLVVSSKSTAREFRSFRKTREGCICRFQKTRVEDWEKVSRKFSSIFPGIFAPQFSSGTPERILELATAFSSFLNEYFPPLQGKRHLRGNTSNEKKELSRAWGRTALERTRSAVQLKS